MAARHTINEYEEEDNTESLHTIISNIIGSMEDKKSKLEMTQEDAEDEEEMDFVSMKSKSSDTETEVQLTSKQIKKQDILENLEDFDESSDEEETSSEEAEEPDTKMFIPTYSEFMRGSKTHLFIDFQDPGNKEAFSHFPVFSTWYDDVGCEKYIDLAKTMKIPAIRRFYESLHTSTVNLEYYGMEGSQIKAMTDALTENTKVRQLKFGNNPLSTDAMYHTANLLRDSLFIKKLNLNSCMLTAESVAMLSEGLELTQYLQELDLSHNHFKDIGLEMLSKGMQLNTSIIKLNLSHNELTHKSGFILAEIFEENVTLTHIDLSWNDINKEQGLKNFMSVTAAQNDTLTHLTMAWNGLTGEKISRCFKPLLEKHKALKMLDLSNNRFEEASALTVFAKSLSKSQTLEEFHLSGNPINSETSLALLSNILPQAKLQHLMISNIWVTQEFNKLQKQLEASQNLKVHFEGVYGDYKIIGPNMEEVLLKRANYLGY